MMTASRKISAKPSPHKRARAGVIARRQVTGYGRGFTVALILGFVGILGFVSLLVVAIAGG